MSAGRKSDPIWLSFSKLQRETGKSGVRVKCNGCGAEMMGLVARMKVHSSKCVSTCNTDDAEVKPTKRNYQGDAISLETASTSSNNVSESSTCVKRPKVELTLDNFATRTCSSQKKRLDEDVARMIYATNSPFRLVENPQFKTLVEHLRPGYKPPSRKQVAGELLDGVYEMEREKCKDKLRGKTVCMALDGWSNVNNEPVIGITVTCPDGAVFLMDSIDTSGFAHDASFLTNIADEHLRKIEKEMECHIGSLVTDNAANVSKMRQDLQKIDEHKNIIAYGCAAHIFNLLAHDLEIPQVKEHVIQVVKYFRNNHHAAAAYKKENAKKLVLPLDVRWNTMCDCLSRYIENWPVMLKICESNRGKIDVDIAAKVQNVGLKRSAEEFLERLLPISTALDQVQSDKCCIADVVEIWSGLRSTLASSPKCVKDAINRRYTQAVTDFHLLSNVLHPKYQGKVLSEPETNRAMTLASRFPGMMTIVLKFQAKSPPFHVAKFSEEAVESVMPYEWWKSHEYAFKDGLQSVYNLMSATASSSGVERIFSTYGVVHTKLRNQLGTENAAKLVFLFKTLSGKDDC